MPQRAKVTINQCITIGLWIVAIYLMLAASFWYLAAFLAALHIVELPATAYRRGIKAGYTAVETITLTLIYGFTWWLYLEKK